MAYQPKSYRKFIAGTMTAAMAASAFAVTTPQQVADAQETTFSDVSPTYYAFDYIERAADRGLIQGYPDGTYRPGQDVNRGQIARMITRALDMDVPEVTETPFQDLSGDHVYADVATAVHEAGIMVGRHNGTMFDAGAALTREQMASVLVRAFDLQPIPNRETNITDYQDAFPVHQEDIEILAQHGITVVDNGLFRPKSTVNRVQIAMFLDRALDVQNTLEAGITGAEAINNTTVDVTFDSEQTAVDAEQFEIPGLEVVDANVVAGPEGENNVVRLVTAAQTEDEEYRLHYNGDRTSITFTGAAADATSPVEVTSVEAITPYGVYVDFEAPGEELVDATVNVTDPNGYTHEVYAQDIAADDTEALFEFVEAPVFPEAGTWIVNGVNYTMEFGIGVEPLDRIGETVELTFNATVETLSTSDIVVRDATTNERRGIASVVLADDGRSAQVMFLGSSDQGGGAFLEPLREYNFQMTIPGFPPATYTYERPAYLENVRVVDSSASNETITFNDGTTLNAYEGTDYEAVLGTGGTVAFNSDYDVVQFFVADEDVLYGAVTDVKSNNGTPVEIELNGEWYDLEEGYDFRYNGVVDVSLASEGGPTADYAKFVLNSQGEVAFYDAYDWTDELLVEYYEDGFVYAFGDELDVSDYTLIADGETISATDLSRGDLLYVNEDAEYGEVYNELVTGNIDRIFADSFVVDGVEYDLPENNSVRYINGDGEVVEGTPITIIEQLEEEGEPVSLYLNRAGDISFIIGDLGVIVQGENGAFLTADGNAFTQGNRGILELSYADVTGSTENIELIVNQLTQVNDVEVGDSRGNDSEVTGFALTSNASGTSGHIVEVVDGNVDRAVDSDGEPNATSVLNIGSLTEETVIEFFTNSDDEIIGLQTLSNVDFDEDDLRDGEGNLADEDRVRVGDRFVAGLRSTLDTPVFIHDDGDYVESTTWGEVDSFEIVEEATVYFDPETEVATYIVIDINDTDVSSTLTEETAVVDRVWYNTDEELVQVRAFVNNTSVTYQVEGDAQGVELAQGDFVEFGINEEGVVVEADEVSTSQLATGTPYAVTTSNRTFNLRGHGERFALESTGYVLDNTGNSISSANFRDITDLDDDEFITVLRAEEGSRFVDIIVINSDSDYEVPTLSVNGNQVTDENEITFNVDLSDLATEASASDVDFEIFNGDTNVTNQFSLEDDAVINEGLYSATLSLNETSALTEATLTVEVTVFGLDGESEEFTFTLVTEEDGTEEDGTEEDGTEEDGTEEDGTEEDGTEEDGTEEDSTEEDGTEEDGTEED